MTTLAFPHLRQLMGAYFNQDFDLHGDTDEEVLLAYKRGRPPGDIPAVLREIDSLLILPLAGFREIYASVTGAWDFDVGEDDAATKEWLMQARSVLAA